MKKYVNKEDLYLLAEGLMPSVSFCVEFTCIVFLFTDSTFKR